MKRKRGLSKREIELRRQGWKRQFAANEPRLTEAVELYQETGYEIHLEPLQRGEEVDQEGYGACFTCFDGCEDQYKVIYTRLRKQREDSNDDLW